MKKSILISTVLTIALVLSSVLIAQETATAPIQVKEMQPFSYCALELTGSYSQHQTAFPALYEKAMALGVAQDGVPFGIYYNSPNDTPESELKWEIGLPLTEKIENSDPLVVKTWEYKKAAVSIYEGAFNEDMNAAYVKLYEWINQNNYVPAGPMMERFIEIGAPDANNQMVGKVEIIVPVEPKK